MNKKVGKGVWLIILVILLVIGTGIFLFFQLKSDHIAEDLAQKKQIKILITVYDGYNLLFSNLFCYDPTTGQSALFDIPVTLGIWDRQLSRYQFLSNLYDFDNIPSFTRRIEQISGVEIPYSINLSFEDLSSLIDLIGGIEVFLIDPVQVKDKEEIRLLPAGTFNLQGYQAGFYLSRTLPGETSVELIKRKQAIFTAIMLKMVASAELFTKGRFQKKIFEFLDTNFDDYSTLSLFEEIKKIDGELMQSYQMRGEKRVIDGVVFFLPQNDGAVFKEQVRQVLKALTDSALIKKNLLGLNLEILNGTKRNLLAGRTTEYYQSYGYNVISTRNAETRAVEKSVVYYRNEEFLQGATRIAEIINCSNVLQMEHDPALSSEVWNGADVSIILGEDYELFSCKN